MSMTSAIDLTEPPLTSTPNSQKEGRWRWWYSNIADAMIRHPDATQQEIAHSLGKHPNTVSQIIQTDLFREYLARRKAEWRQSHDHMLRAKLTDVASESLDIMLSQLKTKGNQIPMKLVAEVTTSALDRLGYAPTTGPTVVIDQRDQRQQTMSVSPSDLEAARSAMRLAEAARAGSSLTPPLPAGVLEEACGAGLDDVSDVVDVPVDPVTEADPS